MRQFDRLVVQVAIGISKDTCGCVCRPLIVYENTFINNIQLLIELTVLRCNKWIGNNDKMAYFYSVYMDMNDRAREI